MYYLHGQKVDCHNWKSQETLLQAASIRFSLFFERIMERHVGTVQRWLPLFLVVLCRCSSGVLGFPFGAGSCIGGEAAVGGSHLLPAETISATFAERGIQVSIGGNIVTPDQTFGLLAGDSLEVEIVATQNQFRGALIRLEPLADQDVMGGLTPGTNAVLADICTDPVVGITHSDNELKESFSGTLMVDSLGEAVLDITIVEINSAASSIYMYGGYDIVFIPQPSTTGAPVGGSTPTTAPGITLAPVGGSTPTSAPAITFAPVGGSTPTSAPAITFAPVGGSAPTSAPTITFAPVAAAENQTISPTITFAPEAAPTGMFTGSICASAFCHCWLVSNSLSHTQMLLSFANSSDCSSRSSYVSSASCPSSSGRPDSHYYPCCNDYCSSCCSSSTARSSAGAAAGYAAGAAAQSRFVDDCLIPFCFFIL